MNKNLMPTGSNNYNFAVEELQKVKTVQMWNDVREQVKPILNIAELLRIDSGGLIVQTLGADYVPTYQSRYQYED